MVQSNATQHNALHNLGYKIFLDRYAQKDMTRETLAVGDTVIVVVNPATGQREIGKVTAMELPVVTIELLDGEVVTRDIEHVDKPIETEPEEMMARVAAGIAKVEKNAKLRKTWSERFRWLLDNWKFVPGGRILAAAGTDQELTFYNCMPPDQEILTDEGYKPIADVQVGDLVVTHCKRLRPVLHKFERETEELLYIISPKKLGYDDLRVTGDHKIYIIRSEWVNSHRDRDGLRLKEEPQWIPAKDIQPGDYVAVAYDSEEQPVQTIELLDYIPQYEVADGKLFKAPERGEHGHVKTWGTQPITTLNTAVRPDYSFEHDGLSWVRIDTIATETYSGTVMDIEVEEDHSFVSAGVVVSNCYVISSPNDSRGGIIETLAQMTEIMSRGGGVGINLSTLRPRHCYVKGVNGRSSGSVSWGALYSFVTGLIEQGGSRRGALMLILNDWHPDVFEFISSKREAGKITNANISVGISDALMEAIKADGDWELRFPDSTYDDYDEVWDGNLDTWEASGRPVITYKTVKARELWDAIIKSAWASAEPGVWFRERSNKMANSWYFNPLIATNPCVTGDTRIYTNQGLIPARELFDDETDIEIVIDGRFGLDQTTTPSTRVFMTGTKPVYRLQTEEGYYVRATADHRFMTPRGWVELQDLRPGEHVHILNRKGAFGQQGSPELGRVLGWLVGDGTVKTDRAVLSFFGEEKRELAPLFAEHMNTVVEPLTTKARTYPVGVIDIAERDEARVQSQRLLRLAEDYGLVENKFQVPEVVFKGTEDMQRGFLQALFTADGNFQDGGNKGGSIRLASNHIELLEQTQQVLMNFGIASRIYRNRREAGYRDLPDGNGGLKPYWCEAQHELTITKQNMVVFADEIGFLMDYKQSALNDYITRGKRGPYAESFTATIASITEDGVEEVFDLTEPITHSLCVNSIVSHNCGEQPLGAFSVCNLGAINLARFYDAKKHDVAWDDLRQTVRYAVRFLDNVIDTTPYFFEQNEKVQSSERRVGLGTMGIAELMIHLGIRYGGDESVAFIDKLYEAITTEAYQASVEIAQEKGAFPNFDAEKFLQSGFMQQMPESLQENIRQHGIRNVTLLTQAPTGTTGTMVNTSTGVEPFFSWVYYRKSRLGLHEEQVPLVKDWYDAHPGETELPDYFATAMDLSPQEHIRVQAAFQRWIDSAISKTCNVPNEYTIEQVSELYEYMYDLGCKGGTIYRDGSRDEQVLMRKEEEPEAKKPVAQVATPHHVYPRPKRLGGTTVSRKTPFGTAYITMNSDEDGNPFEVFITVGKAGSDLQADAEGLGRMLSLQLRTTAPQNRMDMLKLIIDQLEGIGGTRSVGFGNGRVLSLPDAVAGALREQFLMGEVAQQLNLPMADLPPAAHASDNGVISGADMCPECGTISLIRAEGCRKCLTCGYSEC